MENVYAVIELDDGNFVDMDIYSTKEDADAAVHNNIDDNLELVIADDYSADDNDVVYCVVEKDTKDKTNKRYLRYMYAVN